MKRILLIALTIFPFLSQAQYKYYHDSSYNQTFNLLSGSTSINNGNFWDDPDFSFPIGFNFHLFSDTTDSLYISSSIGLGATLSTHPVDSNTAFVTGIIAHGSDLQDRDISMAGSFSPISYNVSGTAPNRICKVEWKNAGFFNPIDAGSSFADSLDFQLWLYETSDIIEVHFGNGNYVSAPNDLYDGGEGPWISIFDSLDINFNAAKFYSFADSVNNPTLDSFTSVTTVPGMIGNPVAGSVYRFTPSKSSTGVGYTSYSTIQNCDVNYVQSTQELRMDVFSALSFDYILSDIQGNTIINGKISKGRTVKNLSSLPSGLYIVRLVSGNSSYSYKLIR